MGMNAAQRPTNRVMSRSVAACVMPATGVRPPFRTFVAVRAIAPVAGIPPNRGEAMFATPCATSSMFERCRPPIMPSATTADSSDSMAPSRAIVKAGPMRPGSTLSDSGGNAGAGSAARTAPNRVPIVSTGRCRTRASSAVTMSATNGLGMRRLSRGQPTMMTRATPAGTAQRRNEKARDDRRVESALGRDAARDCKGDGERQCHDADNHPRAHIGEELLASVTAERGDELRDERFHLPSGRATGREFTTRGGERVPGAGRSVSYTYSVLSPSR